MWYFIIGIAALLIGLYLGRAQGVAAGEQRVKDALEEASRRVGDGSTSPLADSLRGRLEQSWVLKGTERSATMTEAVGRLQAFLKTSIEDPLTRGVKGSPDELRDGAERALSAVQDLNFFADRTVGERSIHALGDLVSAVTGEFGHDWEVDVQATPPSEPTDVRVDGEGLKDALYLILHNARRFGGRNPIRVRMEKAGAYGRILIQDAGPGFSAEALSRAYDPFYSTSPDGLGLGLPHARELIERMGGEIHIRNAGSGGGEVEVSVPLA